MCRASPEQKQGTERFWWHCSVSAVFFTILFPYCSIVHGSLWKFVCRVWVLYQMFVATFVIHILWFLNIWWGYATSCSQCSIYHTLYSWRLDVKSILDPGILPKDAAKYLWRQRNNRDGIYKWFFQIFHFPVTFHIPAIHSSIMVVRVTWQISRQIPRTIWVTPSAPNFYAPCNHHEKKRGIWPHPHEAIEIFHWQSWVVLSGRLLVHYPGLIWASHECKKRKSSE